MAQLQVNDIVYAKTHYGVSKKYTVRRVTPKRAICDSPEEFSHAEFDREVNEHGLTRRYSHNDSMAVSYYKESPELSKAYKANKDGIYLNDYNFHKLSADQLERIIIIINETK